MIRISSKRLLNDKYYTSPDLAEYIINKTKEIIGEENISQYIEPSAGNGVFLNYLPSNTLAYDIEPEDERIIKQDYLELNLGYKPNLCVIGNPPYGTKLNLAIAFYKKSIEITDYISFILPISQLNNNINMYEFDLIHSENLGKRLYSDREVHCCLNIFKRPKNGFNEKHNYKLKDVEIIEYRLGKTKIHSNKDYDIRIRAWGGDSNPNSTSNCLIGCEVEYANQYAKEFAIKIHDEKYKDRILYLLRNVNWLKIYPMTATPNLLQWQVYKYIKDNVKGIS